MTKKWANFEEAEKREEQNKQREETGNIPD